MASVSCKDMTFDERLYNKIKPDFVEHVDPSLLMFYLTMRLADEERVREVLEKDGKHEAAGLLLRLLLHRPDWVDQLVTALRKPEVALSFLADKIKTERKTLLVVVDVEMEDDSSCGDGQGIEPMDVDSDDGASTQPMSEQDRVNIFKDIMDKTFKNLVDNASQMRQTLKHFSELSNVLFCDAVCGCLELHFQVPSIMALNALRELYQGGALCDALSRDILTPSVRQRIRKEAALQNLHFKAMRLTVLISEDDFAECERFLSSVDTPPPKGFLAAKTSPTVPFSEQSEANTQTLLDKLPTTYQQFIEGVADVTGKPETALTLAMKPVCTMVKEGMGLLHDCFKTDETVQKDLIKIGLNLLAKSYVHKKKNVNVICIQKGDKAELVWEKQEKEFLANQKTIQDDYRDMTLSKSVDWFVSEGWLVEHVDRVSSVGKTRYYVPLSLRRDYIICFLLPTKLENLNLNIFLNSDQSLENFTDSSLFDFASIILPYVSCYSETETSLPVTVMHFPDVALFLSSVHAHEEVKEVKDRLQDLLEHFEFPSFLNIQKSADVDNHWKTWKTVAANLGSDHIEMINRTDLDETAFQSKITSIENALKTEHGSTISLIPDTDLQLALRSVALLDLLPCVMEEMVVVEKKDPSGRSDAASQPTASTSTTPTGAGAVSLPSTSGPSKRTDEKQSDSVEMRPRPSRTTSYDRTSQRFSGSSDEDRALLQKEGCLSLDSKKVKGDYSSRRSSDWSFCLDMSKRFLNQKDVSLLCRFLPQLDHVTHFSFNGSGLDSPMIREIVQSLNPQTVKGLSFIGCNVDVRAGSIGLSRMTNLEFLDLEDTSITDTCCSELVREIKPLKNLKEINVGCNEITHVGFSVLSSALISKVNMLALRVHANTLGVEGAAILAQLVYAMKHLEILSVWSCGLGDEGLEILSQQFTVHRKLKRLSIRDNNTSYIGSSKLYSNLSNCKYMQFLDCNESTNLGVEQTDYVSSNLLRMLKASSSWDHVSFWNCNVGQLTIFDNPADFRCLSGVTYLCLQKNALSDDTIKSLSRCIKEHFQYLQHLNLRENLVGDMGALSLAESLIEKQYLEDLWLDWNLFGMDGAKALIERILELPSIASADLSFSFQLSPPEREYLAHLIADPVQEGDLYTAVKGNLILRI